MIDVKTGRVITQEGLEIEPHYTFESFKATNYYKGQDGIRIIYLDEHQTILGRKFIMSLFFRDGVIYMLSLICCDVEVNELEELKRKEIHDKILLEIGLPQMKEFVWGKISSDFDTRSNVSSINILYF